MIMKLGLSPDIVHLPAVRVEVLLGDHEWRIKSFVTSIVSQLLRDSVVLSVSPS